MNAKKLSILFTALLLVTVTAAAAFLIPADGNAKENSKAGNSTVITQINGHAILDTPGLEKKIFIHYAKPACNNNGKCEPGLGEKGNCPDCKSQEKPAPTCYSLLENNVKWRELPQNYVIDPDNPNGLSQNFLAGVVSAGAEEWDSHTTTKLFSNYAIDPNASWDGDLGDRPDGRNEFLFGNYPEPGVIAITVTWGYFSGPPWARKIIEFDVLFDTDYAWGNAETDQTVMDVQNIAAHEIGHGLGLSDIYDTACSEETMYGIGKEGETKKRNLSSGDIEGLQILYGS